MPIAAFSRLRVLNVRELRTHWGRAVASVVVVAVSAALLVAVLGVSGSITGSIDRLASSIGGDADLEVSGITGEGVDEGTLGTVAAVQDVTAAVPLVRARVTADAQPALLIGLGQNASDLHSDLQTAIQQQLTSGAPVTSAPNGVIVGAGLGIAKGVTFHVADSTSVTAVAVVDGPAARRLNDAHFVIAPLALAQQISGREHRLDSILLFTSPGADVARVRDAVSAAVDGRAVVATPSFRAAQASSSFAILQAMTLLAASVSLVVAAFLSYNAMSIAIAQRRPLISTMRALGGRRRTIMSDMLAEAALVGLLGGVVGSAFGVLIGYLAVDELPSTMVQTLDARLEYVLSPWVVPLAVAACVTASVTASALAARQVHAVAPIEALAPSGSANAEAGSRRLRIIAGVGGATLLVATIVVVNAGLGQLAIVSIALAFIGFSALCFAFSTPIIKAAAAVARRFGAAGVLGAASIERAPRRMWVAMMTVLTAVVTTVAVTGATSNAVDSTVASFASIAKADVWVSSAAPTDYSSALLPPETTAAVTAVPGVERVVPDQMAFATVGDTRVMLLGIAADSHRDIYTSLSPRDREKLLAGEGVALSRDLGRSMNVAAGDQISLQTPTGRHTVQVLALVPYFSGMTGTVALSLDAMQGWFDRPGASDLEITVAPGTDHAKVQEAIQRVVSPGTFVYSGDDALAGVASALDQVIAVITIIAWIVVAVSAITLLNTLMLSVLDRRREIGVLRAIGATRAFTLRAILSEAAGIGIVGGLLGMVLGAVIQYLTAIALTDVLSIDVQWRPSASMALIGLGALAICLLGSVPPAVRAARLDIVDAVGVD
ncbi:FtsX-like permease family protein [Mycolicibacterium sp. 050158]|uniref:FtsX-like permease family protein n=1 Tax=Mycolicibacterium sp. 050158 TaxID=3090602 RepID=UPI00299D8E28|nr:FtsX-like permease family protein [Mycolicibacterium sp. 050158]MDX1891465.1 FtsX-like permease family protein [Mycolicibacterium sp. 050158]